MGNEYPVEIIIKENGRSFNGEINYSSLGCSGKLTLVEIRNKKSYLFKEDLEKNNGCVLGGTVLLELINKKTATFCWYYPDETLGSSTVLIRSKKKREDKATSSAHK